MIALFVSIGGNIFASQPGESSETRTPFFELDVQLSVPSVRVSPSLEGVQGSVNVAAASLLKYEL